MKFYAPIQKNGFTASPRGEFVRIDDLIQELATVQSTETMDASFARFVGRLVDHSITRVSAPRHYEEEN